jgi:hypothetical protein
MHAHSKNLRLGLGVLALGVSAITGVDTASAKPVSSGGKASAAYNAIPSKLSGSVTSRGFECCQTHEFGDQIVLGGTGRKLQSMSAVFVSWGCEDGSWNNGDCATTVGATFPVALTFTIYDDDGGSPGAVLAESTQIVNVLYRPSASAKCGDGRWYNTKDKLCYNGFAQTIEMVFPNQASTLPDAVIWSVSFNTTTAGYEPLGVQACNGESGGCGHDSLNVGAFSAPNAPYVGIDVDDDEVFLNGAIVGGWTGLRPLGAIKTKN